MPLLRWLERHLGSRRIAAWALAAWVALLTVWVLPFTVTGVPEQRVAFIATREWYFRLLYAVLLVNVGFCLLPRWRRVFRSLGLPRPIPYAGLSEHAQAVSLDEPGLHIEDAAKQLSEAGWTVALDRPAQALVGVRRRLAPAGTLLFHLSLAAILIVIALSPAGFSGQTLLSEGQSFTGQRDEYVDEAVVSGETTPPALGGFRVDRLRADFWSDKLLFEDLKADVSYRKGGRAVRRTIRLSDPMWVSPTTFVSLVGFNHAVAYTLDGESRGRATRREQVNLNSFPPGTEDRIKLIVGVRQSQYLAYVRVYPDVPLGDPGTRTRSFGLVAPKLAVRITRVLQDDTERELGTYLVRPGEPVVFDGSRLVFDKVRNAGMFRVTVMPSLPWVVAAFVTALAGVVWRALFSREEVYVASGGTKKAPRHVVVLRRDYDRSGAEGSRRRVLAGLARGAGGSTTLASGGRRG